MILEIQGKQVEVSDSFGNLSPDQQEAQVAEIAQRVWNGTAHQILVQ